MRAAAVVSAAVFVSSVVLTAGRVPEQLPETFTNLQVVSKDIGQRELIDAMRGFAMGLGVRCEHCHVGEGNDLSQFDFASDDKPAKTVARQMLRMIGAINGTHLDGIGEPSATPKVTCFTCHRGELKPARSS